MQIALKYARRNAGSIQDEIFREAAKNMVQSDLRAEEKLAQQKKAQKLALAKEQLEQQKVKINKQYQERKVNGSLQ
jgi:hypothetical protein